MYVVLCFSFRSDFIHLGEELLRLQKDSSLEFNKHMDKMGDLLNEFREVYIRAACSSIAGARVGGFGVAVMFAGLALFVFDEDVCAIIAGAGAGMAAIGGFRFVLGRYRKTQLKKNLKQSTEEELNGIQDQFSRTIDLLEKICQRTAEILRDPSLSDHKTQALSEHFACCFEKPHLFQEHDTSNVDDQMSKILHLSGKLSEIIAKVSSVPDILNEIIEDNKRQRGKPAKHTHEQIHKREFKEKAEKTINVIQREICEVKNRVKEIKQTADIILNHMDLI